MKTATNEHSSAQNRARHARAAGFVARKLFDALGSFAELEARIAALASEKERGDAFEVFAEAYLATQKIHQAVEVWPEDSMPVALMQQLALPATDMGVDGVLKQVDGALAAYQVKFRTGRPRLAWRDLSTFIGLADRVAHRILFTNCDDVAEVLNERRDFVCVRGADLDCLTKNDLSAIAAWLRGDGFKPVLKNPREHQQNALADLQRGLAEEDRATAVMACGAGKTLVALWLAERMGVKRILVLVPSLSLIRQTLHEWLKETRWDAPRFLACCSDPSVTSGADDAIVVRPSDLDFPVTTDSREVCDFLKSDDGQVRVVFSTYQSARVVGEAIRGLAGFELGVFDEAHKTAGRQELNFAFALEDTHMPIAKRVFMTATPRHYDVRKKDKEGDGALVYSMDEPKTYGPIVHTLTFTEAVRRGIICDCKIIISVVTSEMLDEELLRRGDVIVEGDSVRAKTVANQVALQKACEAHDLKKVFTFHSTVKSASDFTGDAASSVRAHLPGWETLHVNGALPTARRERVMQAFREADRAVLSNARCLTEGVDVPAVDLVAFLSPRKSKVDIVQAAGRAMRKAEGKHTGYVLLPLFLETAKGESIEDALERTDFAEAWDVIQALREQDEVLADIIREMREERGRRGGFDDARLRERVEVLGPELSLDLIRAAVNAQVVEQFGVTWDERFGQLAAFKEQEGHCEVPQRYMSNPQLANWVGTQRTLQSTGLLTPDRKARLDGLGLVWALRDARWENMFGELVRFREQHGHSNPPVKSPENPKLGTWVGEQRTAHRAGAISQERKAQLDALGFMWDPFAAAWEEMVGELVRFKEKHGHCNVPRGSVENPELAKWVDKQRANRARGALQPERSVRLDALGFVWDPRDTTWEAMFVALVQFKHREGHCDVPSTSRNDPELATWVERQRKLERSEVLPPDRKARLDAQGFVWDPQGLAWDKRFAELVQFKQQSGHCSVPNVYPANQQLAKWVEHQRRFQRKGTLAPERIATLDAVGFVWNARDDGNDAFWEEMYAELIRFQQREGHCNVPQNFPPNPQLAKWVQNRCHGGNVGKLTPAQREKLDALGFVWHRRDARWDEMFSELVKFHAQHGHCNVPAKFNQNPRLGAWANVQRTKRGSMSFERKARLDALGFEWSRKSR